MAIKIITDSASDISPKEAESKGVIHVPLVVTFGEVSYRDAIDLSHQEFYDKLIESDVLPKTSQIPPAVFSDLFQKVCANGDVGVVIALSSKLSGTYQSAMIAAEDYSDRIFIIDSENVTIGQRLLVEYALSLIEKNITVAELVSELNVAKKRIRLLAILDTLEYLKKGGRISATTALAGSILAIKPVIEVRNGSIEMVGKARGSKNCNNLLRKLVGEGNGIDFTCPYCVAYSGRSDSMLKKYLEDNADLWRAATKEVPVAIVGSAIGTHVGPGAIAVAFFELQ